MTRLLVTGSRQWTSTTVLTDALSWFSEALAVDGTGPTMVHGDCEEGADAMADAIWDSWGLPVERHPADWKSCAPECISLPQPHRRQNRRGEWYCPLAGHRRNAHMVSLGAQAVAAFMVHGGRSGTKDCVDRARAAGLWVWVYGPGGLVNDPYPKTVLPPEPLW